MIKGLKVTMTGEELRTLIDQRVTAHGAQAARWKREVGGPVIPDHICENEAARSEWRAERLAFLRDRLNVSEVYLLGEADLEFGELLPEEPELHGPEDYEDSDDAEPHAKRICDSPEAWLIRNPDHPASDEEVRTT